MEKRKAIVVGATSGIGREVAIQLAATGWDVAVAGRRTERLQELVDSVDGIVAYEHLDVNVDDAQMASYALYGYAENVLKSVSVPQTTADRFIEAINANITCGVSVEAIEENSYLTRLLHEKEHDLLNAATKIAKEWDKYALQGQMFIAIVNVGYCQRENTG